MFDQPGVLREFFAIIDNQVAEWATIQAINKANREREKPKKGKKNE